VASYLLLKQEKRDAELHMQLFSQISMQISQKLHYSYQYNKNNAKFTRMVASTGFLAQPQRKKELKKTNNAGPNASPRMLTTGFTSYE